jgi:hypothetical protein
MTIQLQAMAYQLQYQHLEHVPIMSLNTAKGSIPHFTYCNAEYDHWSSVMGPDKLPVCVAQLVGLLQFGVIPRHPQKGQAQKWGNWGYLNGVFRTTLYHQ